MLQRKPLDIEMSRIEMNVENILSRLQKKTRNVQRYDNNIFNYL